MLLDRIGETLGHEVQLEVHLVAELDQHVTVAARQESRFFVDHFLPRAVQVVIELRPVRVDEPGMNVAGAKRRVLEHADQELQIAVDALDRARAQGRQAALDRLAAIGAAADQLGDQRIVVRRDPIALAHAASIRIPSPGSGSRKTSSGPGDGRNILAGFSA